LIETLAEVMLIKGVPEHLRSDNGPEFVARDLRKWLANIGAKTLYIQPGSPWENGFCESFNSKLRNEFLNGKMFYSLKEIRVLAECWRVHYNTVRPHSSRGCRPPAPQAWAASSLGRPQAHDTQTNYSTRHCVAHSAQRRTAFATMKVSALFADTCCKSKLIHPAQELPSLRER
jgi:putative transposase